MHTLSHECLIHIFPHNLTKPVNNVASSKCKFPFFWENPPLIHYHVFGLPVHMLRLWTCFYFDWNRAGLWRPFCNILILIEDSNLGPNRLSLLEFETWRIRPLGHHGRPSWILALKFFCRGNWNRQFTSLKQQNLFQF